MSDAMEAIAREFLSIGQWQRYAVEVDKLEMTSFGGKPSFIATGFMDVTVRLWVPPDAVPSELVNPPPATTENQA